MSDLVQSVEHLAVTLEQVMRSLATGGNAVDLDLILEPLIEQATETLALTRQQVRTGTDVYIPPFRRTIGDLTRDEFFQRAPNVVPTEWIKES